MQNNKCLEIISNLEMKIWGKNYTEGASESQVGPWEEEAEDPEGPHLCV